MKQTIYIGALLLLANIAFGTIISAYTLFNICHNSIVIVIATALIVLLQKMKIKDAFRISLTYIFGAVGILTYGLGFLSPPHIENNWVIIADIIILVLVFLLLIMANFISLKIKTNQKL